MTIAEMRQKALERFNEEYIGDMEKAKNLANRFYRLCGLEERLLYMNNDYNFYMNNQRRIKYNETKAENMRNRLNNDLKEYGLEMYYFGYQPTITTRDADGRLTGTEALARFFY